MKKITAILLSLALLFSMAGCFGKSGSDVTINVYFKDAEANALSAEKVDYDGETSVVAMATFAMEKIVEGPSSAGSEAVLPEGTRFNSISIQNNTVTVDFSEEFTNCEGIAELLARFSVVSTLCDIPGIDSVLITIEGKSLISNATGEEIGVLSKSDIVYETDESDPNKSAETTAIKLYFANSDATALKCEERRVETQSSISMEKTIMTELLKGPSSSELMSLIPSETKLLSIETNNGVCFVNLSSDFVTKFTGGTNTGLLIVYSIVNSLTELDGVESVQILIEGETGAEFGDFVFDEPIVKNENIVKND
ncbi:MAG: GerMN domain-containing protein [Clostridia bacterium]|nr:GerMN domain-containing protein [Clostridia bacterium]